LDTVYYTLIYSNPSSSNVLGVTLTDSLPTTFAGTYVDHSASGGGVYDSVLNTLTWIIPNIPAGATAQFNYQLHLSALGAKYNPVVNNAKLTYPGGMVGASNSISVTGDYVVYMGIYNSAGELVKTIAEFETQIPLTDFSVTNGVITSDSGVAQFSYNGMSLGSWDASNASGGKVTNGNYFVKVDSTDPFGVTTTVTKNISVQITRSTLEIAVYNEAGEIVKHFTQAEVQNMVGGVGGSLLPADFNVQKTTLSSNVLSPSYGASTHPNSTMTITLGSGRSFTWDGRGDSGSILTSGTYFIEIKSEPENQDREEVVLPITIQGNNANGITGVVMGPNPIHLDQTTQAKFFVNPGGSAFDSVTVRIYTIAGELMTTLQNVPGNPALVVWDLSAARIASGEYLAVVEMNLNGGIIGRKIVKAVVIH
jgi:uncharacterized repeat protein (TIGR01451 family)